MFCRNITLVFLQNFLGQPYILYIHLIIIIYITSGKYRTGCGKKSVLYGKYRTVGTFDVRHESAINIIIIYVYNYIYIYIYIRIIIYIYI